LKAALGPNSRITSVEGISVAELQSMRYSDAVKALKQSSALHVGTSGFKVVAAGGKLQSVTVGDFLKSDVLDAEAYAKANPEAMQRFKDFMRTGVTEAESSRLKTLARSSSKKLGTVGALLVFGLALSESANAAENGDTEKARKIMEGRAGAMRSGRPQLADDLASHCEEACSPEARIAGRTRRTTATQACHAEAQMKTPNRKQWGADGWWSGGGSNSRPSHCERDALPAELPPHGVRL
jgi:hypothetical protein